MFIVQKSVVCLRKEPTELHPRDFSHNPLRLSQLLFGEPCRLIEKKGAYALVEALWQPHFTEVDGWHGYRGFVHQDELRQVDSFTPPTHCVSTLQSKIHSLELSFGTLLTENHPTLRPLATPFCPETLVRDAAQFLGAPYLWGGCGAPSDQPSSVDCSGLIHLLYRAQGIILPRDAHPQTLKGRQIGREELQKGDLLYLRKEERHTHVLLFTGEGFLEAPQTGGHVRLAPVQIEGEKVLVEGRQGSYFPTYITFRGWNNILERMHC